MSSGTKLITLEVQVLNYPVEYSSVPFMVKLKIVNYRTPMERRVHLRFNGFSSHKIWLCTYQLKYGV